MLKNGTPASPATARASRVLPVPGGPKSSTPLGMRAPSCWNFLGFSRNSLISCSSSTASSTPATSLNVTLGGSTLTRLALLLPKLMTLVPPPCMRRIMKNMKPTMSRGAAQEEQAAPPRGAARLDVDRDLGVLGQLLAEQLGVGVADGVGRAARGRDLDRLGRWC